MIIELEKNGVVVDIMYGETYLSVDVAPAHGSILFDAEQSDKICEDVLKNVERVQANIENDMKNEKNLECTYKDVASRLVGYMLHAVGYVIKSAI